MDLILRFYFLATGIIFFKKPIDTIPSYTSDAIDILRKEFFKMPWHSIYSFIEITLIFYPEKVNSKQSFINSTNIALERECSAYRIINDDITPITSEQEIQSIEDALENTHPYTGIQQHLNQALKLMSDRQKPDYRNSIKESISAVESICKIVTDDEKATLGQALKIIESKYGLHEALKKKLKPTLWLYFRCRRYSPCHARRIKFKLYRCQIHVGSMYQFH